MLPKALKSCTKSNKFPNLVTLKLTLITVYLFYIEFSVYLGTEDSLWMNDLWVNRNEFKNLNFPLRNRYSPPLDFSHPFQLWKSVNKMSKKEFFLFFKRALPHGVGRHCSSITNVGNVKCSKIDWYNINLAYYIKLITWIIHGSVCKVLVWLELFPPWRIRFQPRF